MRWVHKVAFLVIMSGIVCLSADVQADIIVTWEDNAGDLKISWNGDISGWSPQYQGSSNYVALDTGNGLHALGGPVDLSWTGTAHNWYVGPFLSGSTLVGDSFGSSGLWNWVYMPQNYAGQNISGSATFAGQGALAATSFVAGSRDLGFGQNDNIIFRAASPTVTPEPASLAIWGIGAVGLAIAARRRKLKAA